MIEKKKEKCDFVHKKAFILIILFIERTIEILKKKF